MRFKYENLEIWNLSMDLVEVIYIVVKKFPDEEKFGLQSQGRRAVTSIALNIAEGAGRHGKKDFGNFLNISLASLQEVDTILKVAQRLGYIFPNDEDLETADKLIEKLYYKTIAFRKKLLSD
jgi:four helix bundle protein